MRNLFDGWHIVVLAVVILLLFGWKKMPDMARSFGRSARILRSEMDEMKNDKKSEAAGQTVKGQATTPPATPAAATPPRLLTLRRLRPPARRRRCRRPPRSTRQTTTPPPDTSRSLGI